MKWPRILQDKMKKLSSAFRQASTRSQERFSFSILFAFPLTSVAVIKSVLQLQPHNQL